MEKNIEEVMRMRAKANLKLLEKVIEPQNDLNNELRVCYENYDTIYEIKKEINELE